MMEEPDGGCFDRNYTSINDFHECIREKALAQLRHMSPTQAAVFTFIYAFISLLGALGNGLVMFVVARRAEMRTTRNVFIVNLAISNFLLALILVPFLWLPTYRIEFPYGSFMCKMAQAFPSTNIFCSTLTVSVIAVDRYYVVVRARFGPGKVKTTQAILIAAAIWIISFALSILYFLHFRTRDYPLPADIVPGNLQVKAGAAIPPLFQRCEFQPSPCVRLTQLERYDEAAACEKFYETALSSLTAVFIYFVPMPVLIIFSCLLSRYLAASQRQHASLRHRVCIPLVAAASGSAASIRGNSLGVALMAAANSVIGRQSSNPRRNDPPSAACRRRSRTTSLLFAMAFSNALLWLPFVVISMIIQLGPKEVTNLYYSELRHLDDLAKLISMLSICVNPFLYGYLNTNFNREFKLIFCPWLVSGNCYPRARNAGGTLSSRTVQSKLCGVQGTKAVAVEADSSASAFADRSVNPNCSSTSKQCIGLGEVEIAKPFLNKATAPVDV